MPRPTGACWRSPSRRATAWCWSTPPRARVLAEIPVQGRNPEHAVFSPDGRWLLVSAEDAEQVDVIDVGARRQVGSGCGRPAPARHRLFPGRRRAYVACELVGAVYVVDMAARARWRPFPPARMPTASPSTRAASRCMSSNGIDGTVMVIDTASNKVTATIPVGKRPWNMALTPDGAKLYVANGRSNSVSVIDTASARKVADIAVGELPWGVVIR